MNWLEGYPSASTIVIIGAIFTYSGLWVLWRAWLAHRRCRNAPWDLAQWGETYAVLLGIFGALLMVVGELVDMHYKILRVIGGLE